MYLTSTVKAADQYTQAFRVVLHSSSRLGELVTHLENVNPDGSSKTHPDFYWGHYHTDPAGAVKDFSERCAKYGLKPVVIV